MFSNIGEKYSSGVLSGNLDTVNTNYFQENILISASSEYFIPYQQVSGIVYTNNDTIQSIDYTSLSIETFFANIWNNNKRLDFKSVNIWRHNNGSNSTSGNIGDSTLVNGSNGLTPVQFLGEEVQVSIAQGCGLEWIPNEPYGEPRHTDEIGIIENGFVGDTADFDQTEFDVGINGTNGMFNN